MRTATRDENVAYLRGRFVDALLRERPASVLDVGCGGGQVLRALRAAGVEAAGVEPEGEGLDALRADGLRASAAPAERLPFRDGAFDWVAMRFVPHHLADPPAAFAEALRVARTGFLVAEPWFDPALPGQAAALLADRWTKRRHRRRGQVHEEVLDAARLLAALPPAVACDADVEVALRLRARPLEDLEGELAPLEAELAPGDPDRAELERLRGTVERGGITWNGSVLLVARRAN